MPGRKGAQAVARGWVEKAESDTLSRALVLARSRRG
jgi:hypothetical protein